MCVCVCVLSVYICVCERQRKLRLRLQFGATFLVASLTNGSSFWRAVNCNRHQTPCTENRGASSASSIHCVTDSCLSCLSGCKRRACAPFIHNVGQCLPVKSITSHSGAVGDSVISTLIPPKSWEQLRHHALQLWIAVYLPSFVSLFDACNWFEHTPHISFVYQREQAGEKKRKQTRRMMTQTWEWRFKQQSKAAYTSCRGEVKYRSEATNMWQHTE